jgi:uncharacterized membrane protein
MFPDWNFHEWVELVGKGVDLVGVAVIVIGSLAAGAHFFAVFRRHDLMAAYRELRIGVGRSLLLGLELLVAADVIRTVAIGPTFESIGVLAGIVLIRTFLSLMLELELEGRWPWQHHEHGESDRPLLTKESIEDDDAG